MIAPLYLLTGPPLLLNIATGRPTWQTSTYGPFTSDKAVDGNRATYMSTLDQDAPNSCIHTLHSDEYPVWAVDLGLVAEVHFIEAAMRGISRKYYVC